MMLHYRKIIYQDRIEYVARKYVATGLLAALLILFLLKKINVIFPVWTDVVVGWLALLSFLSIFWDILETAYLHDLIKKAKKEGRLMMEKKWGSYNKLLEHVVIKRV